MTFYSKTHTMSDFTEMEHGISGTYKKLVNEGIEKPSLRKEEIILDGKTYVKLSDREHEDEKVEKDEKDGKEGEEDEVDEQDDRRCSCLNPSKHAITSTFFNTMVTSLMIIISLFHFGYERDSFYRRHGEGWLRAVFAIAGLIRSLQLTSIIMKAATVKRNAMYVYPSLKKHHWALVVSHIVVCGLHATMMIRDVKNWSTWPYDIAMVCNLIFIVHSGIVVYYQRTNGQLGCNCEVIGDEVFTYDPKQGPMEIAENNKGPIRTHMDEELLDEYSLV